MAHIWMASRRPTILNTNAITASDFIAILPVKTGGE
jgi:hypothetical protein